MNFQSKIAVVGCCAAGKSTIAARLRALGFDAYSVAQEHSVIRDLWKRADPDVVVYLGVDLATIRQRKANPDWPGWLYEIQVQRLTAARASSTLFFDTDGISEDDLVSRILLGLPDERVVDHGDVD